MLNRRTIAAIASILGGLLTGLTASPSRAQLGRDRPDFFERGQFEMEQQIRELEQQQPRPSDDLLTVEGGGDRWQRVIVRDADCSIWAPTGTMTQDTREIETAAGKLDFKILGSNAKSGRYVLAYSDPLSSQQLSDPNGLLSAILTELVTNTEFAVVTNRPTVLPDGTGIDVQLASRKETINYRIFIAKRRAYVLAASQPEPGAISKAAEAFLGSFQSL